MLREVSELEDVVISTGGGTSCFSDNLEWMLKSGYVVYLKLEIDTLLQRLKRNPERRPMLLPNDDIDAFRKHICDLLQCREPFYERAHVVLPVTNSKIADITERIELLYTDNKIRLT